jgi:hypothetical protein
VPPDDVTEKPLEYYERGEGKYDLPKYKYKDVYDKLYDKFKEKLPLDFLDKFKNASSNSSDLIIRIDFSLPNPFNVHVGPEQINLSEIITDFAQSNTGNTIRLVLLVMICLYFIVSVLGVIFV